MTGLALRFLASSRAILFAPPIWPDKMGITNLPFSSHTMTAGSVSLDLIYGAMALTAMPAAPINIRASYSFISFSARV